MSGQLSIPRAAALIKEQLADLEKVKSSINYNEPFDISMKFSLESLKRHEEELREELMAAEMIESASIGDNDPASGESGRRITELSDR